MSAMQVEDVGALVKSAANGDDQAWAALVERFGRRVWSAFQRLPDRCQRLLRVLIASPPPSYVEVAVALDLPIGSIGPTRARCLEQLRKLLAQPEGGRDVP